MKPNYGAWIDTDYKYIDLDGKPIKRTREEYPYSYDPYVVWKGDYHKGKGNVVYSDRLYQWDYKKYNDCSKEIWDNEGQYFNNRKPEDIEKFLSLYSGHDVKLTVVMEGCNVSSGYPVWIFFYEDN